MKCLRCGECCWTLRISSIPGYDKRGEWTGDLNKTGVKPLFQPCRYLLQKGIILKQDDSSQIDPASCRLHNSELYPEECKSYAPYPELKYCIVGLIKWRTVREKFPQARFPQWILEALNYFEEIKDKVKVAEMKV